MQKKILSIAIAMVLSIAFWGAAHALNIGGSLEKTAKDTTKGAARGAVQNEYNKKLSKEACEFVGDSTTDYKGCNVDKSRNVWIIVGSIRNYCSSI